MRKSTLRTICAILAVCLVGGAIGFGSGLLKVDEDKNYEIFGQKPNENNVYTVECMTLVDSNDGRGVTIDVDERTGAIKLNGTASDNITKEIGKVDLKAGTYTLTAVKGASMNGVYVTLKAGSTVYNFDFTPGNTFTVSSDLTGCAITLNIKEGAELNYVNVLPVIVSGDEAESFYK